jgi:hypothetical protein
MNMTNPYVEGTAAEPQPKPAQGFWIETWWVFVGYLRFGGAAMLMSAGAIAWRYVLTEELGREPSWPELAGIFAAALIVNRGTSWWRRAKELAVDRAEAGEDK